VPLVSPKLGSMRLAVLDLGSNTFHLLLAEVEASGSITRLGSVKRTLRLGAEIPVGGVIAHSHWQRAMVAIDEILAEGSAFDCRTLAVATSVFREAANGRAFAESVQMRFGMPVELLSGTEEARLSYLGAMSDLPPVHGPVAVVDAGGGSIQLTVGEGDRCLFAASLPFGVLRLCETAAATTSDAGDAAQAIAELLRQEAKDVAHAVAMLRPVSLVFASGTARTIASLPLLDAFERNPFPRRFDSREGPFVATRISRAAVAKLGSALIGLDADSLSGLGVPSDRHASVGAGAIALQTLMELLAIDEATVATRALREGVIVRALHAAREPRFAACAEGARSFRSLPRRR
jgi:exopolyphosphatase/guanosine-5'-triphosphate,3'-diphosphate pyrophosphatase